jgi:hypothetical protein
VQSDLAGKAACVVRFEIPTLVSLLRRRVDW